MEHTTRLQTQMHSLLYVNAKLEPGRGSILPMLAVTANWMMIMKIWVLGINVVIMETL
jgi:hypothetical protein